MSDLLPPGMDVPSALPPIAEIESDESLGAANMSPVDGDDGSSRHSSVGSVHTQSSNEPDLPGSAGAAMDEEAQEARLFAVADRIAETNPEFKEGYMSVRAMLETNANEARCFTWFVQQAKRNIRREFESGEPQVVVWDEKDVEGANQMLQFLARQRQGYLQNLKDRVTIASQQLEHIQYILRRRAQTFGRMQREANVLAAYGNTWGKAVMEKEKKLKEQMRTISECLSQGMGVLSSRLNALSKRP